MYTAPAPWIYHTAQLDWVDSIDALELWLCQTLGAKGQRWDYYDHSQLQQIVFQREQDYIWYTLRWSRPC